MSTSRWSPSSFPAFPRSPAARPYQSSPLSAPAEALQHKSQLSCSNLSLHPAVNTIARQHGNHRDHHCGLCGSASRWVSKYLQRRGPRIGQHGASHVYSKAVRLCTFVLDDFNRWSKNSSYSRDHFFRDDKKLSPISWEHWCGGLLATARPGHHWKWCTSPIRQQEDPVPWCTGSALFQSRLALLLVLQCLPPGVCTRH